MTGSSEDLALWDKAAVAYTGHVTGVEDSFYRRFAPFLWPQLGDVRGSDVLDLGCGHGWLTDELRRAGANVTGIDGSSALLADARRRHPGIPFVQHDLAGGLPRAAGPYDHVVAHMVLMDIPELEQLVEDVAAALRPGGTFIFSVLHPAFFGREIVKDPADGGPFRKVAGYLEHETRFLESFGGHHHYHRPLSWYIGLLVRHGLVITGLHEPRTLPQQNLPEEEWNSYQRWFSTIPTMLATSARRVAE